MPNYSYDQYTISSYYGYYYTGSPLSIGNMYRGGPYVPNISANSAIPTSGTIPYSSYYGSYARRAISFTVNIATSSYLVGKTTYYMYGWSSSTYYNYLSSAAFGSVSGGTSFTTPGGTYTVQSVYFDNQYNSLWFFITTNPTNGDNTFSSVQYGGYGFSTNPTYYASGYNNATYWGYGSGSGGGYTSGSQSFTLYYYG